MTKFRSSRGRTFAALLATALISSILALVAIATAGAQVEEGALDADGNRRLAGADRFDTAIKVAQNYVNTPGSSQTDIILVSGRSLVDAIPAVSIAASRQAPVILTEPGSLHPRVEAYINENQIQNVFIVGRERAVSFETRDQLNQLASTSEAAADGTDSMRLGGENRWETATIVARTVETLGTYCGTLEPAVFMVNGEGQPGDDEFLLDGVTIAPFAYALGMPVLLTAVNGLPDEVDTYLNEVDVGHVVIMGGEGQVGPAVVSKIEEKNIRVTRIEIAPDNEPAVNSPDRAAALFREMSENCDQVNLVPNTWALLDRGEPIDGVTAAATLATGMGVAGNQDRVVPVLAIDGNVSNVGLHEATFRVISNPDESNRSGTIFALGGVCRILPGWVTVATGVIRTGLGLPRVDETLVWDPPECQPSG